MAIIIVACRIMLVCAQSREGATIQTLYTGGDMVYNRWVTRVSF